VLGSPFTCNICGTANAFAPVGDWRETRSCDGCGCSVRYRSLIYWLNRRLFGEDRTLSEIEYCPLVGVGLSDAEIYAPRLAEKFDYRNTFYHQDPFLDIASPTENWAKSADFLISSDVFEHVPPPVQHAFDGAAAVLRPGGLLVLTVPYWTNPETIEHYPHLRSFRIFELDGEWLMVNRTEAGEISLHRDLVFHGGPGSTLEMRLFGLPPIVDHLRAAGFIDIAVHADPVPERGIFWSHPYGVPITARMP
jgi:SAM-dependent methyltransferase